MFTIEGYDIFALVHKGKRSTIYKGVRKSVKIPVTIKVPSIPPEDPDGTNRMHLEFQLARGLEHPNIIKYHALEKTQQGPALILEDFNAICFNEVIKNESLDIKSFLNVSLQIVNGLKAIHDQNVIHNDLTPGNILINPLNFLVKICDFSISSVSGKDDRSFLPFKRPEENFAYIPPEQTGRINRNIDQRSDLYSVGALFYEMIAGKKPFDTEDPLELIHCHLAKTPSVPKNIQLHIPECISDIIIKLLSKNPEDRYQSCRGLEYDLEQCREMKNNDDIRPFSLGKKEIVVTGIINHAYSAAYFAMPKMLPLFILRIVQLSARYGNSHFSPISYAGLGMIIGSIFGHMKLGFRYGRVAMNLVESGNNQAIKTTVFFFFNHFIRHWKEPIHKIVPDFSKTYQSGLESGNFIYAAYCAQACSG